MALELFIVRLFQFTARNHTTTQPCSWGVSLKEPTLYNSLTFDEEVMKFSQHLQSVCTEVFVDFHNKTSGALYKFDSATKLN
jgi:hypothetical protein